MITSVEDGVSIDGGELALREIYMGGVRRGEWRFVSSFECAVEFRLELDFAEHNY